MPSPTIQGVALMEAMTGRTPQEVFQHHAEALIRRPHGIVSD
jgi:hypothetical protein